MNNDNQFEGLDFQPCLKEPKENVKKTSVSFDADIAKMLERKKIEGLNISTYVNRAVKERLEVEKAVDSYLSEYAPKGFVRVNMLMHKNLALFLELLKIQCGEIPLANKLAEIIQHDTSGIMNGDCAVYGAQVLERALATYVRALERLKNVQPTP